MHLNTTKILKLLKFGDHFIAIAESVLELWIRKKSKDFRKIFKVSDHVFQQTDLPPKSDKKLTIFLVCLAKKIAK